MENITSSRLFTTRQGTLLLGVIAAVIAAIALIVYLSHYRNSVKAKNAAITVLVAQKLIQNGTPGDIVRTDPSFYKPTPIAKAQLETGAIVDPAALAGTVATTDISPGQQLTSADFGPATDSVANQLGRDQRAVVVPLGSPQEVGGQIGLGSHVDVWVAVTGVNHLLFQNMYVLGTSGGNVTLRATPRQAGQLIFASQNAQIWLVLRPTVGSITKPPVITAGNLTGP